MDKELLYRHIRRRTDAEEDRRIAEWLETDPANRATLDEMLLQWETLSLVACSIDAHYEQDRRRSLRAAVRRWSTAVAAAAAVVMLAFGSYYYRQASDYAERGERMVSLTVPHGQHVKMTLQDGTEVWLNAGTEIEYPVLFDGRERRVRIEGEARFEVRHDAAHPFVVETYACDVRVLGTKFNVEADAERGTFAAALFEGRVEVRDRTTEQSVTLAPDEQVRREGGRLTVGRIENADDYLWTEGYINFKGHTFREILARYEQVYGVEIRLEGVTVPEQEFRWGKIYIRDGIDNAMRVLQHVYAIGYKFDPETRVITITDKQSDIH